MLDLTLVIPIAIGTAFFDFESLNSELYESDTEFIEGHYIDTVYAKSTNNNTP